MSNVVELKFFQVRRSGNARELPTSPVNEAEMRMYWRATRELRAAMAAGDVQGVREWLDEIDVLAMHTANATLRRVCREAQIAA